MQNIILDLCGGTGAWSKPWKDAGYDVKLITLPKYDVRDFYLKPEDKIYGILAAPPCTMFSLARTTAKTPRDFEGAMEVVAACLRIIWFARANCGLKFWALENPTAYLRQFLGKPAMKFQPYEFGDRYKKSTDLWGYFNEPKKNPVILTAKEIKDSRVNTRPLPKIKGLTVADRRAITPAGFAVAFYQANKRKGASNSSQG
jgi:hypothetical protein